MIGGNTLAVIQVDLGNTVNVIGEQIKGFTNVQSINGWLDLVSGDSKYRTYDTKLQESTHVFIADYVRLDTQIKAENSRMVIDGQIYDVMLIDNPMGLNKQLEIYLKFTGGQNG